MALTTPMAAKAALEKFRQEAAAQNRNTTVLANPPRYVYLVYDECHGLISVYGNQEYATQAVKSIACNQYYLDPNEKLEYDSEDCWGWEGVAWWHRQEIIE